jgi:galactokinase
MARFEDVYGRPPRVVADAPGRVNLIGEHTDYNGGLVLPVAIPLRTTAALAPRDDDLVRATSADVGDDAVPCEFRLGAERATGGWVDYVQGLTRELLAAGHRLGGFDLGVASRVPVGSGLASSAALEVAVLRALRAAFGLRLDDVALALVGQRAETGFVGVRVGVMDQMAASLGDERSALLLDTRSLAYRRVPLPAAAELVVIDSGLAHRHAAGAYNQRRSECEAAARQLDVALLGELGPDDLPRIAALPSPLDRRARHVVTENVRVREAVAAIASGDVRRLGELLHAGHASLRDDYEVSAPELDLLVGLAEEEPDVHGARLTGGGFGGAVVVFARAGSGRAVGTRVVREYGRRSGRTATLLVPPAG